ncbi:MAG TPA: NAD(P)H-binding protein [Streptosporangiaceae bacterium]|nr:NAD(P)H-binding protein [Streptosporangiaceae bacterium]
MIVVVGGTGRVGRQVAAQLRERDLPVRVVTRGLNPAGAPPGAEVARADLADPASLETHLLGAQALFLVWPFTSPEMTAGLAPRVAEIAARHAARIVYLSAQPAADQPGSFWALVERAIEGSGASWTFLRPTGFAANTLMWADQIRSGDVVQWPFGAAARALIDERDIAAVAVRALGGDGHAGARYLLSGPAVLTQAEQLAAIGQAIGRDLRWEELPRQAALKTLAAAWGDPAFAETALDAWQWFVDHPETVTSAVQDVTGTPARSFADWAAANAAAFR